MPERPESERVLVAARKVVEAWLAGPALGEGQLGFELHGLRDALNDLSVPVLDPEPQSIGPVRYFDDRVWLDRVWLFLLRFVPKPLRTCQPFGRYFHQPEHIAWAEREAKRMMTDFNQYDEPAPVHREEGKT